MVKVASCSLPTSSSLNEKQICGRKIIKYILIALDLILSPQRRFIENAVIMSSGDFDPGIFLAIFTSLTGESSGNERFYRFSSASRTKHKKRFTDKGNEHSDLESPRFRSIELKEI
jgi:hypothetical protein